MRWRAVEWILGVCAAIVVLTAGAIATSRFAAQRSATQYLSRYSAFVVPDVLRAFPGWLAPPESNRAEGPRDRV